MTAQNLMKLDLNNATKRDFETNPHASLAPARLPLATVQPVFDPYEFHRLRYLDDSASIEHRNASGQWLLDNGFIGCDGRMIILRGGK